MLLAPLLLACRPECADKCGTQDSAVDSRVDTHDSIGSDSDTGRDSAVDTSPDTHESGGGDDTGETDDTSEPDDTGSDTATWQVVDVDDADVKIIGEPDGTAAHGWGAMGLGDFDGDGVDDLLLGREQASFGGSGSGAAYIVTGNVRTNLVLSEAQTRILGFGLGLEAGQAVAGAGDTDGDGFEDLLVGSPGSDSYDSPGAAYLLRGPVPAGDLSLLDADAAMVGEYVETSAHVIDRGYAGAAVAPAGDTDGDGYDDFLVGGYGWYVGTGVAYLLRGPVTGDLALADDSDLRVAGSAVGDSLGFSLAAADLDGDGDPDLVIGQLDSDQGSIFVLDGTLSGDATAADADAWFDDGSGGRQGAFGGSPEDVDEDGYTDLWIDATSDDRGGSNAGGIYLLLGPLAGALDQTDVYTALLGGAPGEYAGVDLDTPGDVDGDGVRDLLVGTSDSGGRGPGHSYLVRGPFAAGTRSVLHADIRFEGDGDDNAGRQVLGPGDLDGDGLGELLIGGTGDDDGGPDAGAAWLWFGSTLQARLGAP